MINPGMLVAGEPSGVVVRDLCVSKIRAGKQCVQQENKIYVGVARRWQEMDLKS